MAREHRGPQQNRRLLVHHGKLFTLEYGPLQPGGLNGDRSTQLGQLLNDTEGKKTLLDKGNRQATHI